MVEVGAHDFIADSFIGMMRRLDFQNCDVKKMVKEITILENGT